MRLDLGPTSKICAYSYERFVSTLGSLRLVMPSIAGLFPREQSRVDFIERYLGFSLDGGDGSFEVMLLIVLVTIITGIALRLMVLRKT
jgi:hypothetical protein